MVMQLSLQHSLVYQPAKDLGKRFPNFPMSFSVDNCSGVFRAASR
jgi:hypothetical protein